eukprot:CAMPEP_0203635472 /NCGR_PEP_ID=MMETSP0088-20131115/2248_1 /ASSEMBLY_ACC=CAM_ASM_001087 /TAXON_ID=426623 /ORGANISM="Chaetoceros affinis, Strain CCMP159" /LENGTH=113 /DNA_ID=CAMNT_0050489369 /DNA_START=62 /DNA_END=403 /DNA_ORIENTATION=-
MDTRVTNEKSLSFHGSITQDDINLINNRLATISAAGKSGTPQFQMNQFGHYSYTMNHDAQKYREEDYTVCVLDAMESRGWTYKFQYDSENHSAKFTGSSYTKKECFLFHKSNA